MTKKINTCGIGLIINPDTNRCVKINGKIGRSIMALAKAPANAPAKAPANAPANAPAKDNTCKKIIYTYSSDSKITTSKFNCIDLPLTNIKYVIGPCSFYHFKYKSRNIYLFGETHKSLDRSVDLINSNPDMTQSNTIMFAGLVYSLATQNPTRTYDLMFESVYFLDKNNEMDMSDLSSSSPTFDSISIEFYKCIKLDLRNTCPYKNLRTHYVDFRRTESGKKFQGDTGSYKPEKVQKQIDAIKDIKIRTALERYEQDALKHKVSILGRDLDRGVLIMDLYGIARIMRDFDNKIQKQNNNQFKGTAENIIYYAGALHIENMANFFTNYINLPASHINGSRNVLKECNSFIKLNVADESLNFIID